MNSQGSQATHDEPKDVKICGSSLKGACCPVCLLQHFLGIRSERPRKEVAGRGRCDCVLVVAWRAAGAATPVW